MRHGEERVAVGGRACAQAEINGFSQQTARVLL